MNNYFEKSLEFSLQRLLANPDGITFLQSLNTQKIAGLSEYILENDLFNDKNLLETAISTIWPDGSVKEFVSHIIWCAHRDALYQRKEPKNLVNFTLKVNGTEHLTALKNKPVIAVCPMTMPTGDAVKVITDLSQTFLSEKDFIIYGENMAPYIAINPKLKPFFAEENLSGIKKIKKVLRNNGWFFTYADFVYNTHASISGNLFGIKRPYSHGLISIALSSKAALLPMLLLRKGKEIELTLYNPVKQRSLSENGPPSKNMENQILCVVIGKILEGLIVKATNQWRLLPTLSHEVNFSI